MATIYAQKNQGQIPEVEAMRREMAELKSLVHQQMIVTDNLNERLMGQASKPTDPVQDRLTAR